jgi:hypothetical protein
MNTFETPGADPGPGSNIVTQIVLGLWLLVSPFVVGYMVDAALWNPMLAGAAVLVLALLRSRMPQVRSLWFINLLPGVWLLVAPFLFDYVGMGAFWNSLITGVLAVIFAARRRGAGPSAPVH